MKQGSGRPEAKRAGKMAEAQGHPQGRLSGQHWEVQASGLLFTAPNGTASRIGCAIRYRIPSNVVKGFFKTITVRAIL